MNGYEQCMVIKCSVQTLKLLSFVGERERERERGAVIMMCETSKSVLMGILDVGCWWFLFGS